MATKIGDDPEQYATGGENTETTTDGTSDTMTTKHKTNEELATELMQKTTVFGGLTTQHILDTLESKDEQCEERVKEAQQQIVEYIDNMRDHDSCECDNCHRWYKFIRNWHKKHPNPTQQ
jgi:hypothetical protein